MSEQKCVITGATSGIGKAAALALARKQWKMLLIGRNITKLEQTTQEIRKRTQNDLIGHYVCDMSSMRDVRRLADMIKADHKHLDVLINNAGAKFLRHQITEEGIEVTLATNHLGHYFLTLSLIDLLRESRASRIINVSSGSHFAGSGVISNILTPQGYDGRKQYAESKLANVLFTYALAAKLKDSRITVNAVDPGGVATNFSRNNGLIHWIKHRVYYIMKRQLLAPEEGAKTIVYLASGDEVSGVTARYFYEMKERKSSEASYTIAMQDELWESSARLCGLSTGMS